ncbi:ATP-binding protein [Saxibacter everestensis]|uniref:Sensor-like histidine kinase SenX3 n=1 Tax=Saxibacter everestensis TaxID=2909229 RepID=A0ABY8QU33_9MICO|nr:ATP-binding protein [Brevibacteriaceae bacterium ZFBP1038]
MDVVLAAILSGVLGLAIGIAGVLAYRLSERARQSEDLHSEHELPEGLSEVLAVLPSAAIVVDAGDDVVKASPTAYTFGLVRGHALASEKLLDLVGRVRQRGLIEELDFEHARGPASKSVRLLHARIAPVGPRYVLVLCDDHTEARRVEDIRRDFVANVSHELKTPIGAISLLAEAVSDASDDAEAVKRFGERMQRESRRLSSLVKEIIDLSRVQDDDTPDNRELIPIGSILHEAVDRSRFAAETKRIRLSLAESDEWYVSGNFELLVTAVRNLVENAINYSNADTHVGIGVRQEGEMVAIAVTDQGIGLSKEAAARVFERFYRVDPARSRQTGGTGLGLSIVKHIIANHGGEVRVWSQPDHGSTFTLVLPIGEAVHDDPAEDDQAENDPADDDPVDTPHDPTAEPIDH